jgi:hypothetical protein
MLLGSGAWPWPCPSMRTHATPPLSQPYSMDLNGVRIEIPGLQLDDHRAVIATPAAAPRARGYIADCIAGTAQVVGKLPRKQSPRHVNQTSPLSGTPVSIDSTRRPPRHVSGPRYTAGRLQHRTLLCTQDGPQRPLARLNACFCIFPFAAHAPSPPRYFLKRGRTLSASSKGATTMRPWLSEPALNSESHDGRRAVDLGGPPGV